MSTPATTPFAWEKVGQQLHVGALASDVVRLRWVWIDESLDEVGAETWERSALTGELLHVPSCPNVARFWQLEWTLEDGSVHGGELHELDAEG